MNDMNIKPVPERQPAFNMPTVVVVAIAVLLGIQAIREYLIDDPTDTWIVVAFAFIPARITEASIVDAVLPGGVGADVWSFVTYAFLHADWTHVAINCVWL